jgi:hypothetical protein
MDSCIDRVLKFIGLPTPTSFYKKFLLHKDPIKIPSALKYEEFIIKEAFLAILDD